MKRPLFWCSALFLAGIYTKHFLPQPAAALLLFVVFLAVLIKIIIARKLYDSVILVLIAISFFSGSVIISKSEACNSLTPYVNSYCTIKLRVCENPESNGDYCVYVCDALSV